MSDALLVTSAFPWLLVLGALPTVGAVVVMALPSGRDLLVKQTALLFSLITLGVIVAMGVIFDPSAGTGEGQHFQFARVYEWIPRFGISFSVGLDGIALVMVALVGVLVPVVLLASWHDAEAAGRSVKTYFALLLVLETLMIGVFAAVDVFLFYVFFEAMLIPVFFLIGSYGGARRTYAAVKFLLYSLVGGLLMLAAVIGLYVVSGEQLGQGTFDFTVLSTQLEITPGVQKALFLGFFIAFAIKAPLFPFHTWLPDAGAAAPTGTAVLLVGVLDKVGTFGFLRYCLPLFPDASEFFAPMVIVLALIGIFYGAFLAMGQRDLKRFVSYTSVAHFGFIALGIFAFTSQAQTGAVFYMVNHGLSTGALFLVIGFLVVRRGTQDMAEFSGVGKAAPVLAGCFFFAGLSSLALPGLNSFVSEFLVLVGTFTVNRPAAVIATVGIILAALYVLLVFQRTMQGELTEPNRGMADLNRREGFVIAPVLALILILGIYPKPVLDVITPAVTATQEVIGQSDPEPTVPTAESGASR